MFCYKDKTNSRDALCVTDFDFHRTVCKQKKYLENNGKSVF